MKRQYYYEIVNKEGYVIKKSSKFKNLINMIEKANKEKYDGAGILKACYYFGEYQINYYKNYEDITEHIYYLQY